ncbi:hypothetical protein H4219_006435, partial [Mycoemilia scoparia]
MPTITAGLLPQTRNKVKESNPISFDDARRIANSFDAQIRQRQINYRPVCPVMQRSLPNGNNQYQYRPQPPNYRPHYRPPMAPVISRPDPNAMEVDQVAVHRPKGPLSPAQREWCVRNQACFYALAYNSDHHHMITHKGHMAIRCPQKPGPKPNTINVNLIDLHEDPYPEDQYPEDTPEQAFQKDQSDILITELQVDYNKDSFFINVDIDDRSCIALFDTGCTGMILSPSFAETLHSFKAKPYPKPLNAALADGSSMPISTYYSDVEIRSGPAISTHDFVIAPIKHDMIIGTPWITHHNAHVDWDSRVMFIRNGTIQEAFIDYDSNDMDDIINGSYNLDERWMIAMIEEEDSSIKVSLVNDHPYAKELLQEFNDRVRDELPDTLPPRRSLDPILKLRPDVNLKNKRCYRMSAKEIEALKEILDKLKQRGQIYECDAEFASPAF